VTLDCPFGIINLIATGMAMQLGRHWIAYTGRPFFEFFERDVVSFLAVAHRAERPAILVI